MKRVLMVLSTLLFCGNIISQQIIFNECYTEYTFEERKTCFESKIFDSLIDYFNSNNSSILESIDTFSADFELFHKNGERIFLIRLNLSHPELRNLISQFFSNQNPIIGIKNDDGKFVEVKWNKKLIFQKVNGVILYSETDKEISKNENLFDHYPLFPNCNTFSKKVRKDCFYNNLENHIIENFSKKVLRKYTSDNSTIRAVTSFSIDENGNIYDIIARAPFPQLEEEIKRILLLLPKNLPAQKDTIPVKSKFSIPINF